MTADSDDSVAAPTQESPIRPRRRLRRALIVVLVALIAIAAIQAVADDTDHQFANFGCYLVGLVAVLYSLIQVHLHASAFGRRYLVPAAVGIVLGGIFSLVRFDGFSGEMVPQFAYRFGEELHLARVSPDAAVNDAAVNIADGSPEAVASADSNGFLGSDRNGVIAERRFAIPESASDIKTLWKQGIGEGWSSFAVVGDRAVTLEQRDERECLTCYRLLDGELLWNRNIETRHENALGGIGPRSTPTIDSGRVYAQGATGQVWCVDLISGDVVWSHDLLKIAGWDQLASEVAIAWGRAGSPLIVDGLCVLPLGGPESMAKSGRSLIAFDAADGTVKWTTGEAQISYGSPMLMTIAGKRQIVSVNEATVTGHSIEDGKVLWQFSWPGQSNAGANCASTVSAGPDQFLVGKGYGGGSALVKVSREGDEMIANAVWTSSSVLKTKFTHACVDGEVAYAISNGALEAVEIQSEESLWRQPRSERLGQGQLLLVDDVLVGQNETGEVVFVDANPDQYVVRINLPALETKTWNIPTVAGQHLLVRNDREAICFFLPAK
ncbi:outer membrane biogenesis protein BamB [Rubripirellula reticaptiva]|uniref:Outer membrane biogenesis protein BamB n=1 Tax=Rubripirellula reticaptiva TaxID=2528013 RepID=A0A5C6EIJ2_9BACT|nr:outer membrane biogenesis protein BamB [Rubripirellula reticaptiva]